MQRDIYVEWSGPYTYEEVISEKEKENFAVKPSDIGLYQIYGNHPLYGDSVLVYIGKTEQKFSKRLKNRPVILENADAHNIQIYLGKIIHGEFTKVGNITDDIAKAESLLIHYHRPADNSSNINSLKFSNEDITVINLGNYRILQKIVSTKGFTKDLPIYQKIYDIKEQFSKKVEIYDEDDGYGFWIIEDKLWFGVSYESWEYDQVLVLEAKDRTILESISKDIKILNEEWYFVNLYGTADDIVHLLKALSA